MCPSGAIAQLGERLAGSQKVAGSNPAGSIAVEEERRDRPGELADTPDEDVPQDPGVPGVKLPADEPEQGFEGDD